MTRSWIAGGLVVATLATLSGLFVLRDDVFSTFQDPGQPFQTWSKPPAPDYRDSSAWMAWPGAGGAASGAVGGLADVFVVVPEVYKGSEHWNLPVEDARRREKLERVVRPNYVEPYRDAGRLFAPLYRQAALYAFLNSREDSRRAQELAYGDVLRAFDVFAAQSGPERPIVVVGHGQGAAHAQRLLVDRLQEGRLRERLAVAYIIDHPLPLENLGDLPACEGARSTGCVVAWSAVMPGEAERETRLRERMLVRGGSGGSGGYRPVEGRELLCTNPLDWRVGSSVEDRERHRGGVSATGFEPGLRPTVHARQTGAECDGGVLRVDRPEVASLRRPVRFGGRLRTLPSNLFYEDLRLNARARVEAMVEAMVGAEAAGGAREGG